MIVLTTVPGMEYALMAGGLIDDRECKLRVYLPFVTEVTCDIINNMLYYIFSPPDHRRPYHPPSVFRFLGSGRAPILVSRRPFCAVVALLPSPRQCKTGIGGGGQRKRGGGGASSSSSPTAGPPPLPLLPVGRRVIGSRGGIGRCCRRRRHRGSDDRRRKRRRRSRSLLSGR
jgi:hypothetical protein